jgi:hypothetical protein
MVHCGGERAISYEVAHWRLRFRKKRFIGDKAGDCALGMA